MDMKEFACSSINLSHDKINCHKTIDYDCIVYMHLKLCHPRQNRVTQIAPMLRKKLWQKYSSLLILKYDIDTYPIDKSDTRNPRNGI